MLNTSERLNSANSPTVGVATTSSPTVLDMDIQNWGNMDPVTMVIVNSGQLFTANDQSEWNDIKNRVNKEYRCYVILDSNRKIVTEFGQSKINYLICKSPDYKECEEMEVRNMQTKGFELFNEYVKYSLTKFRNSRESLHSRWEILQKMNFTNKYHNFPIEPSLGIDFQKIVEDMQEKLKLIREKARKTVEEMNSFEITVLETTIENIQTKDRPDYFNRIVKDFVQINKLYKNPFDDSTTKRFFEELLIFDDFEQYYRATLTEFSRINNVNREIALYLNQCRDNEEINQSRFKERIGKDIFKFIIRLVPSIVDYISKEEESSKEIEIISPSCKVTTIDFNSDEPESKYYTSEEEEVDAIEDQEIQKLTSDIEDLKKEINELNNNLSISKQQCSDLSDLLNENKLLIEKESQRNRELEQDIIALKKDLKMQIETLTNENVKIKKEYQINLEKLEGEKEQHITTKRQCENYESQVNALHEKLKAECVKNDEIREKIKSQEEEISKFIKQLSFYKEEQQKLSIGNLEQMNEYQNQVRTLENQLADNKVKYCNDISRLETLIAELKSEIRVSRTNYQQHIDVSEFKLQSLNEQLIVTTKSNQEKEELIEQLQLQNGVLESKLNDSAIVISDLEKELNDLKMEKDSLVLISSFTELQATPNNDKQKRLLESLVSQLQLICFSLASVIQDRARWIDNSLDMLTNLISGEIDNLDEDQLNDIVRGLCNRWHFARDKKLIDENGSDSRGVGNH